MKLFCQLILPALLFSTIAFGQKNFKDGYNINLQGDTLRGGVDYQEWNYNPAAINFRDRGGKISSKTPANIKAFYLKQAGYYESFTLPLSNDIISLSRPAYILDSAKTVATVFLKRLITGTHLNLYEYTDKSRYRFIVLDKNTNQPQELTYHYFVFNAVETELKIFRSQLIGYAKNNQVVDEKLLNEIQKANYEEKDIIPLINMINGEKTANVPITTNQAAGGTTKTSQVSSINSTSFFVGVALNSGQLKYTGSIDLAENAKNHTDYLPQLNAGVDFSTDPDVGRIIIRVEMSVFIGDLIAESANALKKASIVNLAFKPQIIYNFYIKDPVKIFISTGSIFNISKYSNKTYTVTNNKYNLINGQQDLADKWLSFPLKLGVIFYRRIELYGAYNLPVGLDGNGALNYTGTLKMYQGGINYLFGGN